MKRLNPLNDYFFKRLFGEEESKDNLIAILNAILNKDDCCKLTTLEIIENKELTKKMIDDKMSRLDILAKTADGMQINIEVQLLNQNNMDQRSAFYLARLFSRAIKQGEDYTKLAKVITINILDFDFIDLDKFHTTFHLWEDTAKDYMLTDIFEMHFIEVKKFKRYQEKDLRGNALHRWLKFFDTNLSEAEVEELVNMDNAIRQAETRLEILSSDEKEIALYEAREDALREKVSMINAAEAKGRIEGRIEGKIEGKIEGIVEGELKAQKEIARKMLELGMEIEKVAQATGLERAVLKELAPTKH